MTITTLKVGSLPRDFMFNGSRIPDPDPKMGVEEVRDLLTPSYPEIATATMTGPEDTGTLGLVVHRDAVRQHAW